MSIEPRRHDRLGQDSLLRIRLGEAGRRRVEEHFRVEDMVRAYERLYRGKAVSVLAP
jgi:hypothetical protein